MFKKTKRNYLGILTIITGVTISNLLYAADTHKLLISEFMAINGSTLQDEDGDYPDWLEIHNPGSSDINLTGWYLTDNAGNLNKWTFPDITIVAGEYLVIYASGKNRINPSNNLHTSFKLSGSGEYLALTEPDGRTISYSYGPTFPVQRQDVSYGIISSQHTFMETPTPGSENTLGNQVFTPVFSKGRGFYEGPFEVQFSVADANLAIYYTTDGSRPNSLNGTLYSTPIQIGTTTPLSAVAVTNSGQYSDVITHTYLFIEDILQQPDDPEGYPQEWSPLKFSDGNAPSDYEMDPEVCNDPGYALLMETALTSIPTLSVVTDPGNIFSHSDDPESGGIYIYTGSSGAGALGIDWERQISLEYLDPENHSDFQINCGIKLHGGNSRVPENSQKHSFRLVFRSEFGPTRLNYNFFTDDRDATNDFNTLILRSGYNYSWMHNNVSQRINTTFLQDPFAKNSQLDMGDLSPHNKFVHLYLNSLYWGVYCVTEKVNNDFTESYWGGKEEDYDMVKDHNDVVDGNQIAWNQLMAQVGGGLSDNTAYFRIQGRNADGTLNAGYSNLLDVDNLINYIILNVYIGNNDWDHNNWLAARNRVRNDAGFRFFSWDAENSLTDKSVNMVDDIQGEPTTIYKELKQNEEFRLRFADHLRAHFFDGGAMTATVTADRFNELANELDMAVITESARWGDYRRDVQPRDEVAELYTRNDHWLVAKNALLSDYFPDRSDIVFQQFRNEGLYPDIDAPTFSHYGGEISEPLNLEIFAETGDIYYAADDNDPRQIGGGTSEFATLYSNPVYIDKNTVIKARAFSNNTWSALTMAEFDMDFATTERPGSATSGQFSVNVYPNPFRDHMRLQVDLPQNGNLDIQVFNVDGRLVENLYSGQMPAGSHTMPWVPESLDPGIYFYRVLFNYSTVTGKIIKTD